MRKIKYLLVFICLMLVSCNDVYNQSNNVMVVNSINTVSDNLHLYELYIIHKTRKGRYNHNIIGLIDEAGKYNIGDTLIFGKK